LSQILTGQLKKKADNEDKKNNNHDYDTENALLPKVVYLF